jgi:hypothetical protein
VVACLARCLSLMLVRGGTWSAGYRLWHLGPPQERYQTRWWAHHIGAPDAVNAWSHSIGNGSVPLMPRTSGHTQLVSHDVVHDVGAEACTVMVPKVMAVATCGA